MKGCIDTYGLYLQHKENVIADTKNQTGKSSLKGKRHQFENGSTLLDAAFFIDILEQVRRLSLSTQHNKVDIIQMVTCIDKTREKYKRMLARLKKPDQVWELPTVNSLVTKLSTEETYTFDNVTCKFQCLPFGLSADPRTFTKVFKPVIALVGKRGLRVIIYLGDLLLMHQGKKELTQSFNKVCLQFSNLGFIIKKEKCSTTPLQSIVFLGAFLISINTSVEEPHTKLLGLL